MHRFFASLRIVAGAAAIFALSLPAPAGDIPDSVDNTTKKIEKKKKVDPRNDPDQIGNRNVAKGPNFFSIPEEIELGKGLAAQVTSHSKIIDDPVIAEYINRIGQNLVRNSDAKFPFTIKVIDVDDVNAFALPGGFFFVNSGLILRADTEAELAGVMAHEIAHVAARHITRQVTKSQIAQIMTTPLIFFPGWGGVGARQAAGVGVPLSFMHFSQADESDADLLGLQYMYKTGYDPQAFVDFFEKILALQRKQPNTLSQFFSSHPPTAKRITTSQKNIQLLLKDHPEYVVTTTEFDTVKARLEELQNRRKVEDKDQNGPTLRKKPGAGGDDSTPGEDNRPTLKRREI
jgi:predicted Zn-dependent protease